MECDLKKLTVKWPFNDIAMLPWDLSAFTFRMLPWDLSAFTFRMLPWDLAFPWDLVMFPWDPFHPPGFHFSRGGVPVTTRPSGISAREQKRKTSVTLYFTQWRTKLQFLLRWGAVGTMLKVKKMSSFRTHRMLKVKLPFEDVKVCNNKT